MTFTQLAKKRRSIRLFTPEPLTEEEIRELMKAPLLSPSSKSSRGWEFVAVDDPELLTFLSESKAAGAQFVKSAPFAVIVLMDTEVTDVWIEDGSVASTMLLLQAEDMGLGACWVQIRKRGRADGTAASALIKKRLGIPDKYEVLSIIAAGHKQTERRPVEEDKLLWSKIHRNKF